MFNLIIRPNKRIDKDLFLQSIKWFNDHVKKPVILRILEVSQNNANIFDDHSIDIAIEIRQYNFKCRAYKCANGKLDKSQWEVVNATNEVVLLNYPVEYSSIEQMTIEKWHPLWPLLNYGLEQMDMVPPGNRQGFKNIKLSNIKHALDNLEFQACAMEDDNGQIYIKPYLKEFTKY